MQASWQKRLWKLWKLVAGLIGYILVASPPIFLIALLSIFLWALVIGPALQGMIARLPIALEQKQYLEFAVGQLADWVWRVILLGGFAAVIYEQIKRRETLDAQRDAIRLQVRQVISARNWSLLDELHSELLKLGSEKDNQALRREMADAFYQRTIDPLAADWEKAYHETGKGWLGIAKELDPENESVKLLLEFAENAKHKDQYERVLKCFEKLPSRLWLSFMRYHKENLHFGLLHNQTLERELERMIRETVPEHQDYLLYAILGVSPPLDADTQTFLTKYLIDKELFRAGALRGRAEAEPAKLMHFDFDRISNNPIPDSPEWISCLTDFVKPGLETKHLFIVGAPGDGKTFLNRQIEYWTRNVARDWISLNWTSLIPLIEHEQMSVPLILKSFVRDLGSALDDQERFREIVRVMNWRESSDWRVPLREIKELLHAKGVQGIFVCIDNLDKYPEFRRNVESVLLRWVVGMLRPEIVEDAPPCYLRLFIENATYQQLDTTRSPWSFFDTLRLEWSEKQKREILTLRVQTVHKEGVPIISEQEQMKIIETASSARQVIQKLSQWYDDEREKYLQSLRE